MSYEEEVKEIEDWYWKQRDEILKTPSSGGLDGERSTKGSALGRELSKKLQELKEKYGIE